MNRLSILIRPWLWPYYLDGVWRGAWAEWRRR